MASGEVSRYVYQMKYHYRLPIEEKMIGYPIMAKKIRDIVVPKDKYVMSQLLRYHKGEIATSRPVPSIPTLPARCNFI